MASTVSTLPSHVEELPSGTRLASYEIRRCIGRGAMGEVYEAIHVALDKRVAIKTLVEQSPLVIARFLREAKAAARIRHPNVVDVFDVGTDLGRPYIAMEYLEGEDMANALTPGTPLATNATADLLVPVLCALQAAHAAGIVHRDLKPANIFLSHSPGRWPVPKIVDFGISKLQEQDSHALTATAELLGTPYYMSPEQVGSTRSVDARSDLFSVGVILYQCVTGQLPFQGETLYQVIGAILNSEPPDLDVLADVPPAFVAIIRKALQKRPEDRFQTAGELAQALAPFASERVRTSFAPEMSAPETQPVQDEAQPSHPSAPAMPAQGTVARSGVRRGRPKRYGLPWLLLLSLVAGASVWLLRRASEPVPGTAPGRPLPASPDPSPSELAAPVIKVAPGPVVPGTGKSKALSSPTVPFGNSPGSRDTNGQSGRTAPGLPKGPNAAPEQGQTPHTDKPEPTNRNNRPRADTALRAGPEPAPVSEPPSPPESEAQEPFDPDLLLRDRK